MNSSSYHPGGFDPSKPNGNLAEKADPKAGTFTRWDTEGRVIESRPLTAAELAALTPPPDPRAELLARIEGATMLDEIREIVADAITGGMV